MYYVMAQMMMMWICVCDCYELIHVQQQYYNDNFVRLLERSSRYVGWTDLIKPCIRAGSTVIHMCMQPCVQLVPTTSNKLLYTHLGVVFPMGKGGEFNKQQKYSLLMNATSKTT